jgi:hypothetical protein
MKPPLPRILSAVPPTLHARLEIAKAIRALAGPDEDELLRQRRAELAAIRRDLEALSRDIRKAGEEWLALAKAELREALKKYSPDQPRVPAGNPDGGQWTTGDGGSGSPSSSSGAASDEPGHPTRYAARDTGTRTDATTAGGAPVETVHHSGKLGAQSAANVISAGEIPADSPGHPVQFLDGAGEPITIQGNQILRPYDRPPSMYTSEGAASHLAQYIDLYNQAVQTELDDPTEQNEQALAGLAAKIAQELAQFRHGGSLDAERLQGQYVRDYHDYANIAIGLYLAAAGVRIEDGLRIANLYAEVMSEFHEPMDEVYTHLPRRDVRDIKMGYELYQSGRISSER